MPKDPLDILALDSNATASFFGSLNQGIAQAAATHLNVARQASNIIDTTFRAKELSRVNDQNIRSSIIRDNVAQRASQIDEARFQAEIQQVPFKMQLDNLRLQNEKTKLDLLQKEQLRQSAFDFLKTTGAEEDFDALTLATGLGDPSLIIAKKAIDQEAIRAIQAGDDPNVVAQKAKKAYQKAKKTHTPVSTYNPALYTVIAEKYGPEVADRTDLEYNPNRQAERRSMLSEVLATESDDRIIKEIGNIKNTEERARFQKAFSLKKQAEATKKANFAILDKIRDELGPKKGTSENLLVPTPKGMVPFKSLERSSDDPNVFTKEDLIRYHQSIINKADQDISRAIQSVNTGTDIEQIKFEEPTTVQTVTGAQGQVRPSGLLAAKPTQEQIDEAAKFQEEVGEVEFESPSDVFTKLQGIGKVDEKIIKNLNFEEAVNSVKTRYGLTKILENIGIEGKGKADIEREILNNIKNLSTEDLAKTFFQGKLIGEVSRRRGNFHRKTILETILQKITSPITGIAEDEESRARKLKKFAKTRTSKPGSSTNLERALAEALAEEIRDEQR
jgi:hypothetical protein